MEEKVILPELSYQIVGALFDVSNTLGSGFQEKHYYRAIEDALKKKNLQVKKQVYFPLEFRDAVIGKCFLDFEVDGKVVLEIKIGKRFRKIDFDQVKLYLKVTGRPLGILARFDDDGVTFHRLLPSLHL